MVLATSGRSLSFGEFEARANRLAHLFGDRGLRRGDRVAIFMEDNRSRTRSSGRRCCTSVDFEPELPRLPTGKLYKRLLRDRYWGDATSRIV